MNKLYPYTLSLAVYWMKPNHQLPAVSMHGWHNPVLSCMVLLFPTFYMMPCIFFDFLKVSPALSCQKFALNRIILSSQFYSNMYTLSKKLSTYLRYYHHRSSRPEVVCKKGVLRNFAKITGKQPCQSVFFNKVAGLRLNP